MTGAYAEPAYIEDYEVGDEGPEVVVEELSRVDIARYAGASGDFNRVHVDEKFARAAGNPSVFAHGMLTAGFAAHMASDWFGLENVRRFKTRFTDRVWPGDTVSVRGTVTEKTDDTVTAEITVENQDDDVVLTGAVTAELPTRTTG